MPQAFFAAWGLWQFVSLAATNAAPPSNPARDNSAASAEGTAGLRLTQDRQVDQWLDAAREHLDQHEFALASGFLTRLLSMSDESFTTHGVASILSRDEAWQLTQRLPEEFKSRLAADLDRTAGDAWAMVRAGDSAEEMAAFAVRYRFSIAGLESLRMLAATRRDTGQHELSAASWGRVADHPRATISQRNLARLARIESLIAAAQVEEAWRVCRAALDADLAPTVALGGRNISPREWLETRQRDLNDALVARGASPLLLPVERQGLAQTDPSPALQPVWTRPTLMPANLLKTVSDTQRYFRGQGVVSSLALRPLVVGRVVIARTMENLVAFDLATGETTWKEPVPHPEYSWIAERPLYLENDNFRSNLIGAWHRRTEADSVFGSLTTDGQIVIAVMEPDRSRFEFPLNGTSRPGRQNGIAPPGPRWNRLSAYEVATGELRWQVGGEATGPADLLGGYRFLGPPLPVDNLLFGIARREDNRLIGQSSLNLLALDKQTGHLRWSVLLGVVPSHLADADSSRRIACPVTLADGRLLCPTAGGVLIAVDPTTRGVTWAARYPVRQRDVPAPPVNGIGVPVVSDAWWNEWREVMCCASSSVAVIATPESDRLQGLELDTGRAVWDVARSGALHLVGLFGDLAIVSEPMAVRAHDLRTGSIRWRCETGEISGRGTIVGTNLLQPRRAGGVAVVDLRDGARRDSLVTADTILGTLIPCGDGWISQTDQALIKLPLLTRARDEALAKWTIHTTDENAALDLARLDLQAGDPAAARSRLLDLETPRAKAMRREALLSLLRSVSNATPPSNSTPLDHESLSRELIALSDSHDERLVALRVVGEAAAVANDPAAAVTSFLEGLELIDSIPRRSADDWSADGVAARSVRRDRVFVGNIERVLDDLVRRSQQSPAADDGVLQRRRVEQTFEARLLQAKANSDPFAVQRLVDRLFPLEWGRRTLLAESRSVQFARTLKKIEPTLVAVSSAHEERLAVLASRQLIDLLARSGWQAEADAAGRRLLIEHPDAVLDQSSSTLESPADAHEATRRARFLSPPLDPWPNVIPSMDLEPKDRNEDVHYVAVSVDAAPGSLLDRLDVSVERQGRFVRFAGEGHAGKWTATLAGPQAALRPSFAALDQCQAWGVGRLLVLRLGSELFCFSPLDERGEPHAKSEWPFPLDLTGGLTSRPTDLPSNVELTAARVGLRHERLKLIDGFGRAIGRVGPVRPDYLCYQSQARLVAIETQTGRRLWERLDVPPHCIAFGDEDRVYLWRTTERTLQVMSAIDGRIIETRPWAASSDDLLQQCGSLTWLAIGGAPGRDNPEARIELHDARDGALRWSIPFAAQAVPFVLDRDTLGVIEPTGLLHLLSAHSGRPLCLPLTVAVPAKLERIVCHHDDWRWYVAFSGPVARQAMLQNEQIHGGRRLPFLNGPWYAIDRATNTVTWQRQLDHEPLSLDASRMAPIFVQMWRQPNLDNAASKGGEGYLRLIDKRTGSEIAFRRDPSLQPYFVLNPTANRETLDIRTERDIVRLKFTPRTAP